VVGHIVLLLLRYGTETASLWGDWLSTAAALLATTTCWLASRSAGPFGKRVWRLVMLSGVLLFVDLVLFTYYYDYLHASLATVWPSDFLVFFWAVPAMMTLFLSPRDPNSGFRWLRTCDFVQVCSLVLAVVLTTIYVPSLWQSASQAMEDRAFSAGLVFFGLLAIGFLIRGVLTPFRTARRLFQRLAVFFFFYGIVSNLSLHAIAAGNYRQGNWLDLFWTIVFVLLTVIAAMWNHAEQQREEIGPRSRRSQLLAQFSPLLIPAIVFPLVLGIAQEQFLWAVVLVTVSFAAAGGRMFVVQNQLLVNSQELQKNLSLLQAITEGTTDTIFVKDLEGRYVMVNSAGASSRGLSVREAIGKTAIDLNGPEEGRAIMERDRKLMQSGEMQTFEETGSVNGEARIYHSTKGPLRDLNGEIVGLVGISRDITIHKRAEEEFRQSQQKLRNHFEHTPLGVIEWSTDFRVVAWNAAAERIFGYSREEAVGKRGHFIVHPQYREAVDRLWQRLLSQEGGIRGVGENDNVTKDGRTISCEWYNTPLVDDSGRVVGVASLVHDVTERVALEEKLRQSEKMDAIGRLAGGVAHDFNNLLTVILGYTQIMMDGVPSGSRLANATAQIKSAAERAAGITRQLLAFSRKQVRSPQLIDLNNVMMNLDTMLRRLIGEDIEVLSVPGSPLGTVNADPGQIEQVLMNLALNARDAMPSGGTLTLETANVQLDDAYAHEHQPVEPGAYVMLAVSDTGIGMSPETLARIFEPFYTTKEQGKGTGLGLSTVYGIVKASGGYVWVYSELGQGTTFKIYLPRVDQPAHAVSPEKTVSSVQRGTETILLVEDDPQLIQLSSTVLANCGYKVLAAASPEEALTLCRANQANISLLVTDVVMPKMNGRQLAEEVTRICPNVRLLYVSGYTSNAIVHYGVLDAGLWFLPKPFSLSALVAKVREILDAPGDGKNTSGG